MPALNQNLIIYDLDKFHVRFAVTDTTVAIDALNARVWWGVATSPAPTTNWATDVKIQKSNNSWTPGGALNTVEDFGDMSIGSYHIDVEIPLNSGSTSDNQSGSVNLNPTFTDSSPVTYYHECVYSAVNQQQSSTVVSTGTVTVYQSLFTKQEYRK